MKKNVNLKNKSLLKNTFKHSTEHYIHKFNSKKKTLLTFSIIIFLDINLQIHVCPRFGDKIVQIRC